jgi:hypothetical protein
MAKRVWKEKVYPLETQISIQRGYVMQHENALAEAQTTARITSDTRSDMFGHSVMQARIDELVGIVAIRERDLAAARQKLAELEAKAAA